jgi:hypothetical protein
LVFCSGLQPGTDALSKISKSEAAKLGGKDPAAADAGAPAPASAFVAAVAKAKPAEESKVRFRSAQRAWLTRNSMGGST